MVGAAEFSCRPATSGVGRCNAHRLRIPTRLLQNALAGRERVLERHDPVRYRRRLEAVYAAARSPPGPSLRRAMRADVAPSHHMSPLRWRTDGTRPGGRMPGEADWQGCGRSRRQSGRHVGVLYTTDIAMRGDIRLKARDSGSSIHLQRGGDGNAGVHRRVRRHAWAGVLRGVRRSRAARVHRHRRQRGLARLPRLPRSRRLPTRRVWRSRRTTSSTSAPSPISSTARLIRTRRTRPTRSAVENAVYIANELDIPLLYIGTAGIFDGRQELYDDWDAPNPLGAYARAKWAGERVRRAERAPLPDLPRRLDDGRRAAQGQEVHPEAHAPAARRRDRAARRRRQAGHADLHARLRAQRAPCSGARSGGACTTWSARARRAGSRWRRQLVDELGLEPRDRSPGELRLLRRDVLRAAARLRATGQPQARSAGPRRRCGRGRRRWRSTSAPTTPGTSAKSGGSAWADTSRVRVALVGIRGLPAQYGGSERLRPRRFTRD